MSGLPRRQVLIGDATTRLRELPEASVDCVITSPPYYAMRDYGHKGQLGAEADVDAWAEGVVRICRELRRILKPAGALWLSLGDGFSRHPREGARRKSLLLGPQRVALKLVDDGWMLRNTVVWAKANPIPSSTRDRLTTGHEVLYFLVTQPTYHFDLDAIREPAQTTGSRSQRAAAPYLPRAAVPSLGSGNTSRIDLNHGLAGMKTAGRASHPLGKNPGDVWRTATAAYRGAHFATFPVELVRRPLLATCPERVCDACGQPWQRVPQHVHGRTLRIGPLRAACHCRADWHPGVVLDPFFGAGTVAIAAETYRRDWLGIEINQDYAALAEQRLADWRTQQENQQRKEA